MNFLLININRSPLSTTIIHEDKRSGETPASLLVRIKHVRCPLLEVYVNLVVNPDDHLMQC